MYRGSSSMSSHRFVLAVGFSVSLSRDFVASVVSS